MVDTKTKPECMDTGKPETLECDDCVWYSSCDSYNDRPLCKHCNGSGEGQTDGSICHYCKGRGTR